MSNHQTLKVLINERLSATAEEIFALFEQSIAEYQREIIRLKNVNEAKQMQCVSRQLSSEVAQQQTDTVGQENEQNSGSFHCKEEIEPFMIALEDESQMLITNVKSLDSGDEFQPHGHKQLKLNKEGPGEQTRGAGADTDHSFQPSSESEEEDSESDIDDEEYPFGSNVTKKPFICSVCKKRFPQRRSLKMHMKWAHANEKPHTSAECNTQLNNKLSLSQQDMEFIMGKPFSCPVCKREFKFRPTLDEHMKVHGGGNPYSCTLCNASFSDHVDFICHMKTAHSVENPFKCSVCNKSLKNARNYRTHMLIHTGDRPFLCSVCGRGFLQSGNLKYHMLTHTGEKPFSCSECGARYTSKQNLMHHKKTNH